MVYRKQKRNGVSSYISWRYVYERHIQAYPICPRKWLVVEPLQYLLGNNGIIELQKAVPSRRPAISQDMSELVSLLFISSNHTGQIFLIHIIERNSGDINILVLETKSCDGQSDYSKACWYVSTCTHKTGPSCLHASVHGTNVKHVYMYIFSPPLTPLLQLSRLFSSAPFVNQIMNCLSSGFLIFRKPCLQVRQIGNKE